MDFSQRPLERFPEGVKQWDSRMQPGTKVCLLGSSGVGKSVVMRELLFKNRDQWPVVIVFSQTEFQSPNYTHFIPGAFVFPEFDPDQVEKIVERQREVLYDMKHNKKIGCQQPEICMIVDDCGDQEKELASKVMKFVYMMGRHIKISLLIALQYLKSIGPKQRNQFNVVILCKNDAPNAEIYKSWFTGVGSLRDFDRLMDRFTANYHVFISDRMKGKTGLPSDQFYWYLAEYIPDPPENHDYHHYFPVMQQFHVEHYEEAEYQSVYDWDNFNPGKPHGAKTLKFLDQYGDIVPGKN